MKKIMENWCSDTDRVRQVFSEKDPSLCHFFHHMSMTGMEPEPSRWKAGNISTEAFYVFPFKTKILLLHSKDLDLRQGEHCTSIRDKSVSYIVVRIIWNTGVLMWTKLRTSGAIAKLRKATISFIIDICLCSCPSIRPPAKKDSLPLNEIIWTSGSCDRTSLT